MKIQSSRQRNLRKGLRELSNKKYLSIYGYTHITDWRCTHDAYCEIDRTSFSKTQSKHNCCDSNSIHQFAFIRIRVNVYAIDSMSQIRKLLRTCASMSFYFSTCSERKFPNKGPNADDCGVKGQLRRRGDLPGSLVKG